MMYFGPYLMYIVYWLNVGHAVELYASSQMLLLYASSQMLLLKKKEKKQKNLQKKIKISS